VTIAWQGGEPTLMRLDFFRRALEVEKKYLKPGMQIENTFQTNGVLLDEEWCRFFHENNFLIGLSVDGPKQLHDTYRYDKGGDGTFDKVVRAARLMQEHKVEFNVLCTVNAVNSLHPLEVYRFFRDELGARYLQFIPIVERENHTGYQEGTRITDRSVRPDQWGRFLIAIFDEWVRNDIGKVFIQLFDESVRPFLGMEHALCIYRETCGDVPVVEHNGDFYSCDHYVLPEYKIGNIHERPLAEMVEDPKQREFGQAKWTSLPKFCRDCEVLSMCNGGCPKDRIIKTPSGEDGLNYLCAGLKSFFGHSKPYFQKFADLVEAGEPIEKLMEVVRASDAKAYARQAGRNDPCPCGSGKKYKRCCGGARPGDARAADDRHRPGPRRHGDRRGRPRRLPGEGGDARDRARCKRVTYFGDRAHVAATRSPSGQGTGHPQRPARRAGTRRARRAR